MMPITMSLKFLLYTIEKFTSLGSQTYDFDGILKAVQASIEVSNGTTADRMTGT